MIEQLLIKKTLKAGDTVWLEGSIESSPLPAVLLEEARLGTGTVEVLKGSKDESPGKLIFVAKRVEETDKTTTTTSQSIVESGEVVKPKPKLIRRKR